MKETNITSQPRRRLRIEAANGSTRTRMKQLFARPGFHIIGRGMAAAVQSQHEKDVLLPLPTNDSPGDHAWALARFCSELMAEHAWMIGLLTPPELSPAERLEAMDFSKRFEGIGQRLDFQGPPRQSNLRAFVREMNRELEALITFKLDAARAQRSGELQSFVWPSFFEHTAHEASRWRDRLDAIAAGQLEPQRKEMLSFWGQSMGEHFRFIAHYLDPQEHAVVRKAFHNADKFHALDASSPASASPWDRNRSSAAPNDPEWLLSVAQEVVEFKTEVAQQMDARKVHSIITPILLDHFRREAVWFVDEIKGLED